MSLITSCESGSADDLGSSETSTETSTDTSTDTSSGTDGGEMVIPTVVATMPEADASDVPLNAYVSVTFSEAMDPATLTDESFSVGSGQPIVPIKGTVVYTDSTAVFWPASHFDANTSYTATVTVDAHSSFAVALAEDYVWSFATGTTLEPGEPVDLGDSGDYVILAKAGISTVPGSDVVGDLGVSPAAATYITGFSLTVDASNTFATSDQVTGKIYASDYEPPTPSNLTAAVGDMETAFTDAAGRAPDVTELGAGNIGGMTLMPGVYKWGTGLLVPIDVTLDGSSEDVWIFQIGGDLTMSSGVEVVLTGGAQPGNVFWQVAGLVQIGTTAHARGVVLSQTSVTLQTGASLDGRILAQTAVDIDGSTIVEPAF